MPLLFYLSFIMSLYTHEIDTFLNASKFFSSSPYLFKYHFNHPNPVAELVARGIDYDAITHDNYEFLIRLDKFLDYTFPKKYGIFDSYKNITWDVFGGIKWDRTNVLRKSDDTILHPIAILLMYDYTNFLSMKTLRQYGTLMNVHAVRALLLDFMNEIIVLNGMLPKYEPSSKMAKRISELEAQVKSQQDFIMELMKSNTALLQRVSDISRELSEYAKCL